MNILEFHVEIGRLQPVDNHKAIQLIANFLSSFAHQFICRHCQLSHAQTETDTFDAVLVVRRCTDPQIKEYIERVRMGTVEWLYAGTLKCYTIQLISGGDDNGEMLAERRILLNDIKVITQLRSPVQKFVEMRKKLRELLMELQLEEPNEAITNGNKDITLRIFCTLKKRSKYDEEAWEIVPGNFGELPLTNKRLKEDKAASFETKALTMKLYKR